MAKRKRESTGGQPAGAPAAAAGPSSSSHTKKRQRQRDASNIVTESRSNSSFIAGTGAPSASNKNPKIVSDTAYLGGKQRRTLPAQLDVESVLASRKFQIRAMLKAMRDSRSAQTTRAWQLLPRNMRRRAASHNLLRLPSRLRAKGLREMQASNTQPKTRAETRKNLPNRTVKMVTLRREKLRERSKRSGARWLETHLWHAKRFHMTRSVDDKISKRHRLNHPSGLEDGKKASSEKEDLSMVPLEPQTGFILAEEPHMKAHRGSWRSAQERVIVHDASYETYIMVSCSCQRAHNQASPAAGINSGRKDLEQRLESILARCLKRAGIARGWEDESEMVRYRDGSRECSTVLLGKPGGRVVRSALGVKGKAGELSAEKDPVLNDRLPGIPTAEEMSLANNDSERSGAFSTTERPVAPLPTGEGSLLSQSRLVAPVRVLWLPRQQNQSSAPFSSQEASRQFLVRCNPNAAAAVRKALEDSIAEENEIQKIQFRHRRRTALKHQPEAEKEVEIVDGGPTRVEEASEVDLRYSLRLQVIPNAPAPEDAVRSGRKSPKSSLKAKLKSPVLVQNKASAKQHKTASPSSNPSAHSKLTATEKEKLNAIMKTRTQTMWRKSRRNRKEKVVVSNLMRIMAARSRAMQRKGNVSKEAHAELANLINQIRTAQYGLRKGSVEVEGFNTFELVGPDSGRLLGAILRPVASEGEGKKKALQLIANNVTPEQAPQGMVLALNVHDPRLSFPPSLPKNDAVRTAVTQHEPDEFGMRQKKRKRPPSKEPSAPSIDLKGDGIGSSAFWTRNSAKPVFSKGDIDHRKAKQLIPGSKLEPTSMDDIVPVIIIQHSSVPAVDGVPKSQQPLSLHGFTLLVPRSWGTAFWLSLVHPGTRVAGQVQLRQQAVEGGRLSFPHDYLGTAAFDSYWKQQALVCKREWKKRPKGKRRESEKLGIQFPYGGKEMWTQSLKNAHELAKQRRLLQRPIAETIVSPKTQPWLLHIKQDAPVDAWRQLAQLVLNNQGSSPQSTATALAALLALPGEKVTINDISRLASAVVPVSLTACRRGNFDELAPVFLDDYERDARWRDTLQAAAAEGHGEHKDALQELENGVVDRARQVGAITTGGYSLTQGKGYAMGCIALLSYLEVVLRDEESAERTKLKRKGRNPIDTSGMVIVRNMGGPVLRAASAHVLSA